jgi:outer membrane protein, adhesin transport system
MKPARIFIFWIILGLIFSNLICYYSSATAETIPTAVSRSLTTHPEIISLNYESAAARDTVGQARSGYLPRIDIRLGTGYENTNNSYTRSRYGDHKSMTIHETGLVISQNLFNGFKTSSLTKRSKMQARTQAYKTLHLAERMGLRVVGAYIAVLQARELQRLAVENVKNHKSLYEIVKQRVGQKVDNRADLHKASARKNAALAILYQMQAELADARARYKNTTGIYPEELAAPDLPEDIHDSHEESIDIAMKNNPFLAYTGAMVEHARADFKAVQSDYYPRLDLELAHNKYWDRSGVSGTDREDSIMLVVSQNIFSGGFNRSQVREALNMLKSAQSNHESARLDVAEQLEIAYAALSNASARRAAYENQVADDSYVNEAFMQQYKIGRQTLFNILEAQEDLFISSVNLMRENSLVIYSKYNILAIQGLLLRTIGVTPPEGAQFNEKDIPGIWENIDSP